MDASTKATLIAGVAVAAIGAVLGVSQVGEKTEPVKDGAPSHVQAILCGDHGCERCDYYRDPAHPEQSRVVECVPYNPPQLKEGEKAPEPKDAKETSAKVTEQLAAMADVREATVTLVADSDAKALSGCACANLTDVGDCEWLKAGPVGKPGEWVRAPTGLVLQEGTWRGNCVPCLCRVFAELTGSLPGGLNYALAEACRPAVVAPDGGR
jgi:hypothetical protein